eukprot:6190044-Pleurochrysis_carterae.AAC.1
MARHASLAPASCCLKRMVSLASTAASREGYSMHAASVPFVPPQLRRAHPLQLCAEPLASAARGRRALPAAAPRALGRLGRRRLPHLLGRLQGADCAGARREPRQRRGESRMRWEKACSLTHATRALRSASMQVLH